MKKIPTLFERVYENHKVVGITDTVTPGFEWVLDCLGLATVKVDGSCCAVINGEFYKRYDAKKGKKPPVGAIPCCDPDPVTGHWPHWVKVDPNNPADKHFVDAYENSLAIGEQTVPNGTYEAIGPGFQGNPYGLVQNYIVPHGEKIINPKRTFNGIRDYLRVHNIEGIVFWRNGEPQCKIKRSDFGFKWPGENFPVEGVLF